MLCCKYLASLSCKCSNPHDANLRLEYRKPEKIGGKLKFEIVFAVDNNFGSLSSAPPWKWRETELEPHNSGLDDDGSSSILSPSNVPASSNPTSTNQLPQTTPSKPALHPGPRKSRILDRFKFKMKSPSNQSAKGPGGSFTPITAMYAFPLVPIYMPQNLSTFKNFPGRIFLYECTRFAVD
jgi:hypothetical protein